MTHRRIALLTLALAFLVTACPQTMRTQEPVKDEVDARGNHFVARSGHQMFHKGQVFRMAGANNYYPEYVSQFMVDNLFTTAAAQNFNSFRVWGFLDIGNADGSNSVDGPHNGVYFHYWNGSEPAFNDGATGLQKLDYVIYRASQLNVKLIIPFVNNYDQFGGMDQYVRWRGGQYHDQFYSDATIRQWYKQWISHVLNHTNYYTGIQYKNDATIMIWELANEERCAGYGVYPQSSSCNTETITDWAADVSAYVKTIDHTHLLSAGDEGFYCTDPSSSDFTINCSQGVDAIALAKLPAMDILSYHLYPDSWGKSPQWGTDWVRSHIQESHKLGDRAVAGEWGLLEKNLRNVVYQDWENVVLADDGAGALYWILSGVQDDGTIYPDYDGYTVYCPSPVCSAFTNFARQIENQPFNPAPVADNYLSQTPNKIGVNLDVQSVAISYEKVPINKNSIDLDPSTPGQQTTFTTASGTYTLGPTPGKVHFDPASQCISGNVSTPYTIKDELGRVSSPANIVVSVGGIAGELYNFEDGTDTWTAASFNSGAGTVAQSTTGATSCLYSLQVNATGGGWFGPAYSTPPLPVSTTGVSNVLFDITTGSTGTSEAVALQFGSDYHWCQTPFGYINAGTKETVTVNLASLTSSTANCQGSLPKDTSVIQGMFVYFSGGGTYYLDNVRTD